MAKFAPVFLFLLLYLCEASLGENMIRSTALPKGPFNTNDILSAELFVIEEKGAFTASLVRGMNFGSYIYTNGSWTNIKGLLNAFVKDGKLYVARDEYPSKEIVIYMVQGNGGLVRDIDIKGDLTEYFAPGAAKSIITVPEQNDSYYLLAARSVFPANAVEYLFDFMSGGHGIYYVKPLFAEVRDGKLGEPKMLQYGGKRDETYYIKQVAQSDSLVHFLGFRQQEKRAWGGSTEELTPVILHHAAYDLKKKKMIQANPVYTDTPRGERDKEIWYRYAYGTFSMDAQVNDIFVTFTWAKLFHYVNQSGEQFVESNILYWDCIQGKSGEAKKIADGFNPVVKADSLGNVHLLYVNVEANLMHKVRRKGVWQKEDVLADRVDIKQWVNNIAAAFDKDNNLHVVYPLDGGLIHSVLKVN